MAEDSRGGQDIEENRVARFAFNRDLATLDKFYKEFEILNKEYGSYKTKGDKTKINDVFKKIENLRYNYEFKLGILSSEALELNNLKDKQQAAIALGRYTLICETIGNIYLDSPYTIPQERGGEGLRTAWKIRLGLGDDKGAKRIEKIYEELTKLYYRKYAGIPEKVASVFHLGGAYKHRKETKRKIENHWPNIDGMDASEDLDARKDLDYEDQLIKDIRRLDTKIMRGILEEIYSPGKKGHLADDATKIRKGLEETK
jgi:hypothetical protein